MSAHREILRSWISNSFIAISGVKTNCIPRIIAAAFLTPRSLVSPRAHASKRVYRDMFGSESSCASLPSTIAPSCAGGRKPGGYSAAKEAPSSPRTRNSFENGDSCQCFREYRYIGCASTSASRKNWRTRLEPSKTISGRCSKRNVAESKASNLRRKREMKNAIVCLLKRSMPSGSKPSRSRKYMLKSSMMRPICSITDSGAAQAGITFPVSGAIPSREPFENA